MYSFLKSGVKPDSVPANEPFIPRKIWQTTKDRHNVSPELAGCVETLKSMNPEWAHQLFDDEAQRTFLESVCSDRFMRAYDRIQPSHGAARADMFRYVIAFLHGGAYMDLKAGTTRPLEEILRPDDRFILSQWDNGPDGLFPGIGERRELRDIQGGEFEQWFTIAVPGHPFLAEVLERVLDNVESYDPFEVGHGGVGILNVYGPNAYTRAIHRIRGQHPHRMICAWHEGLRYTQFECLEAHRNFDKFHYHRVELAPVTSVGLTGPARVRYYWREALAAPYFALRKLNRARLRRHRARKAAAGKS